jgi:hypothetical protein
MNPSDDLNSRQQATNFSAQLGELSAGVSPNIPPVNLDQTTTRSAPTRLSTILGHLARRPTRQEDARRTLMANEFMSGG